MVPKADNLQIFSKEARVERRRKLKVSSVPAPLLI